MASINGTHTRISTFSQQLRPESLSIFAEGISLTLSRWTGLQLAIQNEWGGGDTRKKSEQLASDLFSWFSHPRVPLQIDDLENMLDENMVLSFNTDIDDGSIEEQVAEELMIMHEDCLRGNIELIGELRKFNSKAGTASHSKQINKSEVVNKDGNQSLEGAVSITAMGELKHPTRKEQKSRLAMDLGDKCSLVATRRNGDLRNLVESI